jgi:hypothetical protein
MQTLLLLLAIAPAEVLVHELAHAAVALRLTTAPVHVHVGRYPGLARFRLGRLHVNLHLLPARGVRWAGICVFDPLSPTASAQIIAAGPLGSLAWAVCCAVVLRLWGGGFDVATRGLLGICAVSAAISAVYNGSGAFLARVAADRPDTDGALLRRALKAQRALRAHERAIGRRLTRAEMIALRRTRRVPESARRDVRGSVAPPG